MVSFSKVALGFLSFMLGPFPSNRLQKHQAFPNNTFEEKCRVPSLIGLIHPSGGHASFFEFGWLYGLERQNANERANVFFLWPPSAMFAHKSPQKRLMMIDMPSIRWPKGLFEDLSIDFLLGFDFVKAFIGPVIKVIVSESFKGEFREAD